jgi:hypothetical protein
VNELRPNNRRDSIPKRKLPVSANTGDMFDGEEVNDLTNENTFVASVENVEPETDQTSMFEDVAAAFEPVASSSSPAAAATANSDVVKDAASGKEGVNVVVNVNVVNEPPASSHAHEKSYEASVAEEPAQHQSSSPADRAPVQYPPQPAFFDYDRQKESIRIQHEEYDREYKETVAEKEHLATKAYDILYAPSVAVSSVVKEKIEDYPASSSSHPPIPQLSYGKFDPFAYEQDAYGVKNAPVDETKESAAKILGIGRYRDEAGNNVYANKENPAKREEIPVKAADEAPVLKTASYKADATNSRDKLFGDVFYDRNTDFLDNNELKIQKFEKYDADKDANEINYKSVFANEILSKRSGGFEESGMPPMQDDFGNTETRPVYFNDVKNKLTNEGYEIRAYNKTNTSEFYAKNYIYGRKINMLTYSAAWIIWLVELLLMRSVFNGLFNFQTGSFLALLFIPIIVPAYHIAAYLANPDKRVKDNFNLKFALRLNLIVAAVLIVLVSVISLLFLGAADASASTAPVSILAPAILFLNIPLSAFIYDSLRKSGKYNLN